MKEDEEAITWFRIKFVNDQVGESRQMASSGILDTYSNRTRTITLENGGGSLQRRTLQTLRTLKLGSSFHANNGSASFWYAFIHLDLML